MEATTSADRLYKDVILIVDPLQHLPFKLYTQQPRVVVEHSPSPPVVLKTHAATGQKSEPITGENKGITLFLRQEVHTLMQTQCTCISRSTHAHTEIQAYTQTLARMHAHNTHQIFI